MCVRLEQSVQRGMVLTLRRRVVLTLLRLLH
jgi:hypothetical protein